LLIDIPAAHRPGIVAEDVREPDQRQGEQQRDPDQDDAGTRPTPGVDSGDDEVAEGDDHGRPPADLHGTCPSRVACRSARCERVAVPFRYSAGGTAFPRNSKTADYGVTELTELPAPEARAGADCLCVLIGPRV